MKPDVKSAVTTALRRVYHSLDLAPARVIQELACLGLSNVEHYVMDASGHLALAPDAPAFAMRAVSSVKHKRRTFTDQDGNQTVELELEFRLWSKNDALKTLAQYHKLLDAPSVNLNLNIELRSVLHQAKERAREQLRLVS
jgi:hypothetical protein